MTPSTSRSSRVRSGRATRCLLEREPKESILARFDLPVIERYFPEYPHEIRRRLAPKGGGRRSVGGEE